MSPVALAPDLPPPSSRSRSPQRSPLVAKHSICRSETVAGRVLAFWTVQSQSRRAAATAALLVAASLVLRIAFVRVGFVNVDEAAHLLGASEVLRGGDLYLRFADNKPPLIHLFYALAQCVFGEGVFSVRMAAAIVLLPLTALGLAAYHGYRMPGLAAALAFLVASTALLPSDAHAVHCEHVMLLPLAWSIVLVRSPEARGRPARLLGVGLLTGVAFLGKQPAALCLVAHALAVLYRYPTEPKGARRHLRTAALWAALAAGFALPVIAAAAWFASNGALKDAVFWVWSYNLRHIDNPMSAADTAQRVAKMGALVLPAALPLTFAAWRASARAVNPNTERLAWLFAWATLLPAFLGLRLFGHYFLPFLLVVALFSGPFFVERSSSRARTGVIAFGLTAHLLFTLVGRAVHQPGSGLADVSNPAYERIASAVRAGSDGSEGTLFVWGYAPQIYVASGRRPASRFVVPVDTLTGYLAGNDTFEQGNIDTTDRIERTHWALLLADLRQSKPEYIVDTAPADLNHWGRFPVDRFPDLLLFLRAEYTPHVTVDGAVIYRRVGNGG
ncbi:MAG: glycosyltransferase family 39 protein [Polyangiaceae bacterium]|nr:glycosyltransferase family 39 protein [Polyangiaceae bacterium]